jgi:hypothetical protein
MKNIIKQSLPLLAVALTLTAAKAVSFTDGDLLLGFRASGGTGSSTTLVIDIGAGSTFNNNTNTPIVTLSSIGNISADLVAAYGSTWYNRTDLFWGIAGGETNNQLYLSKARTSLSTQSSSIAGANGTIRANTKNTIAAVGGQYAGPVGGSTVGTNPLLAVQGIADGSNNWAVKVTSNNPAQATTGGSFGYTGIEQTFGTSTDTYYLDLYTITGTGAGAFRGSFQVTSTGDVNFGIIAAVPEPSTYAMLVAGMIFVVALARRQRNGLEA